jgi:hypothetical protein
MNPYDYYGQGWGYMQPEGMQQPSAGVPWHTQPPAPGAAPSMSMPEAPKNKYHDIFEKELMRRYNDSQGGGRGKGLLGALMSYMSPGGARAAAYMQDNRDDGGIQRLAALKALYDLYQPTLSATDDLKEYNYARSQGYQGSFVDFQTAMKKAGGTNVTTNVGENKYGPIKEGYMIQDDGAGGVRQVKIPGENPVTDKADNAEAENALTNAEQADSVLGAIDGIRAAQKGAILPTTGTLSQIPGAYSESAAGEVKAFVEAIKSPQVLAMMAELKKLSETGATGFGATQKNEIDLMTNELGLLDPSGNTKVFNSTIDKIEGRWKRIKENVIRNKDSLPPELVAQMEAAGLLGKPKPPQAPDAPQLAKPKTKEEYDAIPSGSHYWHPNGDRQVKP